MEYKILFKYLSLVCIFICLFMYWFIYVVGGMNIEKFVNLCRYGVVNPTSFIGMTREEVFKWAEKNRVTVSDNGTLGEIAISWTDDIKFFSSIEKFNNYGNLYDDKINRFLTTNTLSVNYFSVYGINKWEVLTLIDNKVVFQKTDGYLEGIGCFMPFDTRYEEYMKMVNKK